jgi:hypothetical protein
MHIITLAYALQRVRNLDPAPEGGKPDQIRKN